ncbi:MAG: lytic transglycosylase domain-containing protein [Sporomusaceae bacterium]|jgi:soluble lytic murein transglycosylase-like protein|nr:lytic transglycosylase domain-containing protein [Sporomusaceae bacterium]
MTGIDQVLKRINSIEERFRQPMLPKLPQDAGQSFAQTLAKIEKQPSKTAAVPEQNKETPKAAVNNKDIASLVEKTALKHGINPKLALAVAQTESNLNQSAVSPVGAVGVMQLMPGTARDLGVRDINNLEENVDGGVRYLKQMLHTFGGDVNKAVAAYNAGPGAVQNYNGIPPYKETENYVRRVNELAR